MAIRCFEQQTPRLAKGVYIDEQALVIGDVEIGEDSSVWPMSIVRGDVHEIRIGARSNIQDGCILHVSHDSEYSPGGHRLIIGNEVTVGHGVILHGCEIADRCLIGMGSTVMDGVTIEPGVILGAGSLVTPGKRLASGQLWVGRPARAVRLLDEREKDYLQYSALHYVRLKNRYLT